MKSKSKAQKQITLKRKYKKLLIIILCLCVVTAGIWLAYPTLKHKHIQRKRIETLSTVELPNWIIQNYIDVHDAARTGNKLKEFNNIVIHYVGNPGTTAMQNREFFNNDGTNVSSHFIVGLEGEIIQCLPLDEISAASNHRNIDTISIEVCHPDDSGRYSDATYNSLVKLTAWLCQTTGLTAEDVIRHYDVTGKLCPMYYVINPNEWDLLIEDIGNELAAYG